MRAIIGVAGVAVVGMLAAGCGSLSDPARMVPGEAAQSPTGSEADEPQSDEETSSQPALEQGGRDNPFPPGETVVLGDWEASVAETDTDASDVVVDEFDEAPDGALPVVVELTATYAGEETGTAWADLVVEFVSADGNTFDGLNSSCYIDNDLAFEGEQYPGASVTGGICLYLPSDAIDGGTWHVEETLTLDGYEAFFALE
jgi:hypothetical protein